MKSIVQRPTRAPRPPRPAPNPPAANPRTGSGARLHEVFRVATVVSICLVMTGLVTYALTFLPKASFSAFDINAYREKLARRPGGESMRSIIARQLGADGLTPNGIAGWVDYEAGSGSLVMRIKNRHGQAVEDADVRAAIARPGEAPDAPFVLTPDAEQRYSADVKSFGRGTWDVTVTAVDPKSTAGSGLLFRIEKNITID